MKLVPIPPDFLDATAKTWLPFVEGIAKRQRCHVRQRLADIYSGAVHLLVVWDEIKNLPRALVGLSIMQEGDAKRGKVVWLTGVGRHEWVGLNSELEQYCQSLGCNRGMSAIARPGWSKTLKELGYRQTHVIYEKDF